MLKIGVTDVDATPGFEGVVGWGGAQGSVHGLNVDKHKALFPAQSTVKPSMLLGN